MTRKERHDKLKKMWDDCPLTPYSVKSGTFYSWQGMVVTLLSYNKELQAAFRDAVKNFTPSRTMEFSVMQIAGSSKPTLADVHANILKIMAEAINELTTFPDEEPRKNGTELTDEHGLKWFWSHSTRGSRLVIGFMFLASLAAAFGIGWRVGATRVGSTLYNQYNIDPAPIPISAATEHHPTVNPASIKAADALTKSLLQPTPSPSASSPASATPQTRPK